MKRQMKIIVNKLLKEVQNKILKVNKLTLQLFCIDQKMWTGRTRGGCCKPEIQIL